MAINFCHCNMKPRIYSDKVSNDSYKVQNLVSNNFSTFRKGFLAEYFIKPPVCVTLEFPVNIEIQCIVIEGWVGSQKSCGFDVLTQSIKGRDCWLYDEDTEQIADASIQDGTFTIIAKGTDTSSERFWFFNPRFRPKPPFTNTMLDINSPEERTATRELRHHQRHLVENVSRLMIRITRTIGSGVPGIKAIQVWGQPVAIHSKPAIMRDILQFYHKGTLRKPKSMENHTNSMVDVTKSGTVSEGDINCSNEVTESIPEEFLDELTYEIMAMPVLLPSGHTIDQSTLDKHNAAESKWGRAPGDPFTGVPFHGDSKPVPNSALKARLDQFILKDGSKLGLVPRTTGRASDLHNLGLVPAARPWTVNQGVAMATSSASGSQSCSRLQSQKAKRFYGGESGHSSSLEMKRSGSDLEGSKTKRSRISHNVNGSGPCILKQKDSGHHEEKLRQSLDSALSSALKGLPSYSRKPISGTTTRETTEKNVCGNCKGYLNENLTYRLPCSHLICRDCLTASSKLGDVFSKCEVCYASYSSSQVVKAHV